MQQLQMRNASSAAKLKDANRKSMTVKEMRVKRQSTIDQIEIKRNFYGIDEAVDFLRIVYTEHGRMIQNFLIVFFYYLLGGWFYSSCSASTDPKMAMYFAPCGTGYSYGTTLPPSCTYIGVPGDTNSIAMNNFYFITVTMTRSAPQPLPLPLPLPLP